MNLPNWITVLRILLIPFFVIPLLKYRQVHLEYFRFLAVVVFLLAVLSDALDGAIARIRKQKTALGALLDPLADKLLLLAGILMLSLPIPGLQKLPIWVPVTFISRDLILMIGALLIYIHKNKLLVVPSIFGKAATFFQMTTIFWILLKFPAPEIIWRPAGVFTIISGISYVYQGAKQLGDLEQLNEDERRDRS